MGLMDIFKNKSQKILEQQKTVDLRQVAESIDVSIGCGDIRLDANLKDILETYGEPDEMSGGITKEYYRGIQRDGSVTKLDTWQATEDTILSYKKKNGFRCIFDHKTKMIRYVEFYPNFISFKTKEGIGPNSTIEDIKRIYGKPKEEYPGMKINGIQTTDRIVYSNSDFLFEDVDLIGKLSLTRIAISNQNI